MRRRSAVHRALGSCRGHSCGHKRETRRHGHCTLGVRLERPATLRTTRLADVTPGSLPATRNVTRRKCIYCPVSPLSFAVPGWRRPGRVVVLFSCRILHRCLWAARSRHPRFFRVAGEPRARSSGLAREPFEQADSTVVACWLVYAVRFRPAHARCVTYPSSCVVPAHGVEHGSEAGHRPQVVRRRHVLSCRFHTRPSGVPLVSLPWRARAHGSMSIETAAPPCKPDLLLERRYLKD